MTPTRPSVRQAPAGLPGRLTELAEVGVRSVRLQYADLHGICRGKDIPISAFPACRRGRNRVRGRDHDRRPAPQRGGGLRGGLPGPAGAARPRDAGPAALAAGRRRLPGRPRGPGHPRAVAGRPPRGAEARAGRLLRVRRVADRRARARVLPLRARPAGARTAIAPTRLRTARCTRSGASPTPRARCRTMLEAAVALDLAGDRRRPRVRPRPVRDQPAPRPGAQLRRPRVSLQGDGQGDGRPRRPAGHLHGQAVQRRRGLGSAPARVVRGRRRQQRVRRGGRAGGPGRAHPPLPGRGSGARARR